MAQRSRRCRWKKYTLPQEQIPLTPPSPEAARFYAKRAARQRHAEQRAEFERVMLPHHRAGFLFALHLTRNHHDAEDIVQSAMLAALRKWGEIVKVRNPRAWLCRIIRYEWVAVLRERRGQGAVKRVFVEYKEVI